MECNDWANLPEHIVVQIMLYLPLQDRFRASLVCKSWNSCFQLPYVWRSFDCIFIEESHDRFLKCFNKYGQQIKSLHISLNQSQEFNRQNSISVLEKMRNQKERRLETLKIKFIGENPYFYAGLEYVNSLKDLFDLSTEHVKVIHHLKDLDLSGLTVMFDDNLIEVLSKNNPQLERVNIQNKVLVCKVSPESIFNLIQRCRKLVELCVFMCSVSEQVLLALTEDDRVPLKSLSLSCRRDEKYTKDMTEDAWKIVSKKLPNFRVALIFDHSIPLHKVNEIMCPSIPVSVLRLETYTYIYDEVRTANRYYNSTLEKMVLATPLSRNSPELNKALIEMATDCTKLKSMHVFCVLEKKTVEEILRLHPKMEESQNYTLKYTDEPAPWVAGRAVFSANNILSNVKKESK